MLHRHITRWLSYSSYSAAVAVVALCGAAEPVGQVVVLRNGNVLSGAVQAVGRYYRIEQNGATLQIPANQVDSVCGSLREAYEFRRQNRVGSSVDSNLELTRWCLRHNMLDEAARELLDARSKDARHPALSPLDLQLRQQLAVAARKAQAAQQPAPASRPDALPAAHEEQAPPGAALDPPMAAQADFVRSIQPMLIHNCAGGGCHQAGGGRQFQLDRWALKGNGNPTLIRRNLDAVLAQLNRDEPSSSPLVRWARQSHGPQGARPSRPLGPYQAGLLLEWANDACGFVPEPPGEEPTSGPTAAGRLPTSLLPVEGADAAALQPPGASVPATMPARSSSAVFRPRDPFDPEMFNRQRRKPPKMVSGEASQGAAAVDPSLPEARATVTAASE